MCNDCLLKPALCLSRPKFRGSVFLFWLFLADATTRAATFTVTNTNAAGTGSLSNAIAQANLSAVNATNFIQFAIPPLDSNTVHTITLPSSSSFPSPLPRISRRVIIDGYTQPGASSNTLTIGDNAKILIRLDGSGYNGVLFGPILELDSGSDGSTIRGLAIVEAGNTATMLSIFSQTNSISGNFIGPDTDGLTLSSSGAAILVNSGASGNIIGGTSPGARNVVASGNGGTLIYNRANNTVIQGNYVGVNAAGSVPLGSSSRGIHVSAGNGVIVGGTNSGVGNLINSSFGTSAGVLVANEDASIPNNAVVQGNLIGTDATGTIALRTLTYGVQLQTSTGTLIGGTNAGAGNVISSVGDGIFIANSPTGALIQGNKIGTDNTGTIALGNSACGIEIYPDNTTTTNGTIGGTGAGQGNIIAFNHLNGVSIAGPNTGWSILGNSIHDNGLLGITLTGCGTATPTTNDACGTLSPNAANHHQMFPVITGVSMGGGNVTLSGSLNSTSNKTYRLEFFSNPSCDPRGYGQGTFFLGFTNVTTDATCSANFTLTLTNPSGFASFTSTATDTNGNTSEFSACASPSGPCAIICPTNMVVSTAANQCGATVFFTAATTGNCGAVTSTPASGSLFPKGTNTVICSTGGGTNCSFTITVLDTLPPTIVCPANIVTNVPFGQSNAVVNYPVVFSDNCGLASSNSSPPSGSVFPLGVTTVTCAATDTSSNTNFCTFTVTVANTNLPPVARCQSVTTNASASCQANVPASAVDNGSSDPDGTIVSRTLSPPGPYPKGTNTVTLTVVDNLGASNSCVATIIVLDTTPPSISCPANLVTNAQPGQASVVVTYPPPTVTDNCAVASTNSSPPSGSSFPLGTTTVTCTATDTSGNTNSCSFTVTVTPSTDHFWTNPLGGNYHNATNWLGHLVPAAGDTAYFTSNASYTISWTSNAVARNAFFHANNGTVTQAIGAFSWVVTNTFDIGTNNTATNIVVQTSGALFVTNAQGVGEMTVGQYGNGTYQVLGTNTSVVVDYLFGGGAAANVVIRGGAALRANQQILLGGFSVQNQDNLLVADPGTTVTTETLQLAGVSRLVISNGANASPALAYIGGDNGGNPYDTNNLAIVTGAGSLLLAGDLSIGDTFGFSTDNALIVSNSATVSAETLTVGARVNRFVVDGGSLHVTNFFPGSVVVLLGSGTNQLNHSGLIDTDNLLLTNAASLLQFNGGTLSLGAATVANGQVFTVGNGSDPATLNLVRGSSVSFSNGLTLGNLATLTGDGRVGGTLLAQSGSTIAPGASIGKIVLSNSPSLQGTVLVEISKSGATLTNDQLQVLGPLTYGGVLAVNNVGPDALALGDRFRLFNATSYAGNFSSISLPGPGLGLAWTNKLLVDGSLEVVSNQIPVALCRNVITNAHAGCVADVPTAAVDNGSFDPDGTIVSRTLSPAGPYPRGTNAVTLTVVDDQGASNSCSANIVVVDNPPTIACPANIVTNAPLGQSSVFVSYPSPAVTDACGVLSTNSFPPSGSSFPVGTTTVTCTATDTSGNTNSCSFTVTVNPFPDHFWTNALGGSYEVFSNWLNQSIPGVADNAYFTNNANYQVTWQSGDVAANASFNAASGTVTQAIGSTIWRLTNSYVVGLNAGSIAAVTHTSGSLLVTNSAGTATTIIGQGGKGTYNLNGGTAVTDVLLVTNNGASFTNSVINFNSGTLTTLHGAVVTQAFGSSLLIGAVFGQSAAWNVLGGTNLVGLGPGTSLSVGGAIGAAGDTLLVSGPATLLSNNVLLSVGGPFNSSFNTCSISNGARLLTSSVIIGGNGSTISNLVSVTGSNSFLGVTGQMNVGEVGSSNQLLILSGGAVSNASAMVGQSSGANGNLVQISGPGSAWLIGGTLAIGQNGASNHLVIDTGGSLSSAGATLGGITGANSNSVLISGPGSLWTDTATLDLGATIGNSLVISNGGQLHSVSAVLGFGGLGRINNFALVAGAGSVWSNSADLTVGTLGAATSLVISNGGVLSSASLTVGSQSGTSNHLVSVSAGTLEVTNVSGTGTLDVRRGTNQLARAGLIELDQLVLTNALGFFEFDAGTLNVRATTVTNAQTFFVGDGTNAATLNLVGNGAHLFANGLTVRSNASLTGDGTISGPQIAGTLAVQSGGTVAPGNSIGIISLNNPPGLNGSLLMEISKSGGVVTNDQLQVLGPLHTLSYAGTLSVTKLGADALAGGDRFPLFSASSYGGAFTLITLPALGPGLAWTNKLLVDGSIQVIGLPVPRFSALSRSGTNLIFSGTGGPTNATYRVLASTNVASPLSSWVALLTSQFDANGNFNFTNSISPSVPVRFYRLSVP
jgi:T5SS/PEP-CTERM-associated repeat protein